MINQTHPKILGRLLMGIDAAKRILRRGEPFVLEVSISKPSSKIHGQSSILNTLEKIRLIKLFSFLGTLPSIKMWENFVEAWKQRLLFSYEVFV